MTELVATLKTFRVAGEGVPERVRDALILGLQDRAGVVLGLGEASPLPGYSPDRLEQAREELDRVCDRGLSLDPDLDTDRAIEALFAIHAVQSPSARFALETAALDWLGRRTDRPVHRMLGGAEPTASSSIAELIDDEASAQWPGRVAELLERGVTHIKFKVGANFGSEVETLHRIRRSHPRLIIRLDGNRRLRLEDLHRHLAPLAALGVEYIEEPVPAEELPRALDLVLPIALDETLRDRSFFEKLLRSHRPAAVVLKPMVLGGLRACRRAALLASSHSVPSVISHTLDGPIARAAAAELALTVTMGLAAGLGEHRFLKGWPLHRIEAIQNHRVTAHDRSGLGLRFAEGALD